MTISRNFIYVLATTAAYVAFIWFVVLQTIFLFFQTATADLLMQTLLFATPIALAILMPIVAIVIAYTDFSEGNWRDCIFFIVIAAVVTLVSIPLVLETIVTVKNTHFDPSLIKTHYEQYGLSLASDRGEFYSHYYESSSGLYFFVSMFGMFMITVFTAVSGFFYGLIKLLSWTLPAEAK